MELKYNKRNMILEVFFENPDKGYTVRELSKTTKMPLATLQSYLTELKKKKLITKDNQAETSLSFKTLKINFFTQKIVESGLLDLLIRELNPSCIILFGSIRKGDSNYESDIDLFIETSVDKKIPLGDFEKKLKHKIELFVEKDIHHFQPHLLNNVVNGIKLYGSFKVK